MIRKVTNVYTFVMFLLFGLFVYKTTTYYTPHQEIRHDPIDKVVVYEEQVPEQDTFYPCVLDNDEKEQVAEHEMEKKCYFSKFQDASIRPPMNIYSGSDIHWWMDCKWNMSIESEQVAISAPLPALDSDFFLFKKSHITKDMHTVRVDDIPDVVKVIDVEYESQSTRYLFGHASGHPCTLPASVVTDPGQLIRYSVHHVPNVILGRKGEMYVHVDSAWKLVHESAGNYLDDSERNDFTCNSYTSEHFREGSPVAVVPIVSEWSYSFQHLVQDNFQHMLLSLPYLSRLDKYKFLFLARDDTYRTQDQTAAIQMLDLFHPDYTSNDIMFTRCSTETSCSCLFANHAVLISTGSSSDPAQEYFENKFGVEVGEFVARFHQILVARLDYELNREWTKYRDIVDEVYEQKGRYSVPQAELWRLYGFADPDYVKSAKWKHAKRVSVKHAEKRQFLVYVGRRSQKRSVDRSNERLLVSALKEWAEARGLVFFDYLYEDTRWNRLYSLYENMHRQGPRINRFLTRLAVFHNAYAIVGPHGGAMINGAVAAKPGTLFMEIMCPGMQKQESVCSITQPRSLLPSLRKLASSARLAYGQYVSAYACDHDKGTIIIDASDVISFLDKMEKMNLEDCI